MRKRLLTAVLAAAFLAGCASGSSEESKAPASSQEETTLSSQPAETAEPETEETITSADIELTDKNVKTIGRTQVKNHVIWMNFSGSGVEFQAKAKSLEIMLYGDATATGDGSEEGERVNRNGNRARYAIYLDDEEIADSILTSAVKKQVLWEGDEERTAKVKILKLSEGSSSSIGVRSVTITNDNVDAENDIRPTENKDMLIEFVGDSITCGYGVDDEVASHSFTTSTEDARKTYAYLTAQRLNADYSLVSISGYGIISGFSSHGEIHDDQLLKKYYDKVGFSYAKAGGFAVDSWEWDFNKRQPDVVVINLGTNDYSYTREDAEKRQTYREEYVKFIEMIREKNPNAHIICALGLMGDELFNEVEAAVDSYKEKTGDEKVYSYHIDPIDSTTEGYAADYHPTAASHERCAKGLSWFINYVTCLDNVDVDPSKPTIALTFDDGPNSSTTKQILDILEENGVTASFFLIGNNIGVDSSKSVLRAHEMGCEIDNHSKTHSYMNKLTEDEIISEIESVNEAVYDIIGEYPYFFRPPYFAVNDLMNKTIGIPFITGLGCNDWDSSVEVSTRVEKVLSQAHDTNAAIILLHDAKGNTKTVEALKEIIPQLKSEGYQFLTVTQLFRANGVVPKTGVTYSSALQ